MTATILKSIVFSNLGMGRDPLDPPAPPMLACTYTWMYFIYCSSSFLQMKSGSGHGMKQRGKDVVADMFQ
jgi:hypothetical protein